MSNKNEIKIAANLTIKDWKDTVATLDCSSNKDWATAFNFFEQRITTRCLNPINQILGMDLNTGEGFAVVNLQCSLIETIESFHEGWIFDKMKYYYRTTINTDCLKDPSDIKSKMKGTRNNEEFLTSMNG